MPSSSDLLHRYPKLKRFLGVFNQHWPDIQERNNEPVNVDYVIQKEIPTWPRSSLEQIQTELKSLLDTVDDASLSKIIIKDFGAQLAGFTERPTLREWLFELVRKIDDHTRSSL